MTYLARLYPGIVEPGPGVEGTTYRGCVFVFPDRVDIYDDNRRLTRLELAHPPVCEDGAWSCFVEALIVADSGRPVLHGCIEMVARKGPGCHTCGPLASFDVRGD